jgi:hypothetical protein
MGLVYEDERLEIDYLKSTYEVYSDVVAAFCSSYIRHLAKPTQTQDAHRSSIYESTSTKRQGYLLSALRLSGEMGFTESEVKGLRRSLQDMWKPGTFEKQLSNDDIAEIEMGFEPAVEQDLAEQGPNQELGMSRSRWWYAYQGRKQYFECQA